MWVQKRHYVCRCREQTSIKVLPKCRLSFSVRICNSRGRNTRLYWKQFKVNLAAQLLEGSTCHFLICTECAQYDGNRRNIGQMQKGVCCRGFSIRLTMFANRTRLSKAPTHAGKSLRSNADSLDDRDLQTTLPRPNSISRVVARMCCGIRRRPGQKQQWTCIWKNCRHKL